MRDVDVAVCTFRRQSVLDTLTSVAAQALPDGVTMRVIVADNDDAPSARDAVTRHAAEIGLDLAYLHAPARNISVARNACLEAAGAEWLAFVDDDEVAEPDWIARLLEAARATRAGVVFGPAVASYPDDAPAWMRDNDLHSNRPTRRGAVVETGYCSNALLDLRDSRIRGARFSEAFGRTGGEDVDFFFALHRAGVLMEAAPEAVVREPVARSRMSWAWLVRRRRMTGAIYGHCALAGPRGPSRLGLAARGALKAGYCGARGLMSVHDRTLAARWLLRGAFHAGVVQGCAAPPTREVYGR